MDISIAACWNWRKNLIYLSFTQKFAHAIFDLILSFFIIMSIITFEIVYIFD